MSRGVNKVILLGHLGNDPEMRSTANNNQMTTMSLATSEAWQDKQTGQWQERTEWHRVVLFGRQAEIANQYLRKGSQVYIEGRIQSRKWQDPNGVERYFTDIIASQIQLLDKRTDTPAPYPQAPAAGSVPPSYPDTAGYNNPTSAFPPSNSNSAPFGTNPTQPPKDKDFDDDVPF